MTAARRVQDAYEHPYGVFRGEAAGWSRAALARAVRSGRLHRLRNGLYVPADLWNGEDASPAAATGRLLINTVAATLGLQDTVATHRSSGALLGLPLWSWRNTSPCVTVGRGRESAALDVHIHRARIPASHLGDLHIPATTAARTILDLAREHGARDAVVAGDYALAHGLTSVEELRRTALECARFPGIVRARALIDFLDARSESPLESVSRLVLSRLPFPMPTPQVEVFDATGFIGRTDFYWDALGMVGEVDGRSKYDDEPAEVVWAEKRRQEGFEDAGLVVVRWGMPELSDPRRLVRKLDAGAARARRRHPLDRRWRTR